MTTATPMPAQVRQTLIAVLNQLDNGEAGDLLGEAFDVDQDGYADAVRDLAWCRDELAELLGVPPGTAITADYDQAQPAPVTATAIPETCDGCRDAVPAWLVRGTAVGVQLVCDDCYTAYYQNSNRADAWEADPMPPAAPSQPTALVDRLIDRLFSDGVLNWQAASHYRAMFNPHKNSHL